MKKIKDEITGEIYYVFEEFKGVKGQEKISV